METTHIINKLESMKQLSNYDLIIEKIQELIISSCDDISCNSEEANKYLFINTLLTINDNIISKMDFKRANHYSAILTAYFPNYVNKYFLHCQKIDGDTAFKWIKNFMQHEQPDIITALKEFMLLVGPDQKYDDKHIMFHLMNLCTDGPYSLFDFETADKYEQLLIKSCKLRSIFRGWPNRFNENSAELMTDIVNSEFDELIENIGCSRDITDVLKKLGPYYKIHIVHNYVSSDIVGSQFDELIENIGCSHDITDMFKKSGSYCKIHIIYDDASSDKK